jgi:hypothetical protein
MFSTLGKIEEDTEEYMKVYEEFGIEYGIKNMGLWLTESDLNEMKQFCENDPLEVGSEYCLSTFGMISTSGVSYCDASCVGAVDGKQTNFLF